MNYKHISDVPYSKRLELTRWEKSENRDGFELTQGGQFLSFKSMNVYGGYYQGEHYSMFEATSERKARSIFNQMNALKTHEMSLAYFEYAVKMGGVKPVPLYT